MDRRRRQAAFVFITEGSGNSPRNHEIYRCRWRHPLRRQEERKTKVQPCPILVGENRKSSVSTPLFAIKTSFFSIFRDLYEVNSFAPIQTQIFGRNRTVFVRKKTRKRPMSPVKELLVHSRCLALRLHARLCRHSEH